MAGWFGGKSARGIRTRSRPRFPPDARWKPERSVVEFGIGVGEYDRVIRVSRRVFQIVLPEAPTPERCLKAYYLNRTMFEFIAVAANYAGTVPGRPRPRKEWNALHRGDRIDRRSTNGRSAPNGYCHGSLAINCRAGPSPVVKGVQ